jgi:predicted anti-sigma-YlaC factor YlaD
MKCKDIQKYLSAFLDGELDQSRRVIVEQHLTDCPSCESLLNRLAAVYQFIDSKEEIADPFFPTRLTVRLKQERSIPHHAGSRVVWNKFLIPATIISGLFLGVIIGFQFSRLLIENRDQSPVNHTETEYLESGYDSIYNGSLANEYLQVGYWENGRQP